MRNFITSCAFIMLLSNFYSQTNVEVYNIKDSLGHKQGLWIEKYNNLSVKSIANYENNQICGKYFSFYNSGKTKAIIEFEKGKKNGSYWYYFESGTLKYYVKLNEGKTDYYILFYENGEKEMEEFYNDGKPEKTIHYSKTGVIIGEGTSVRKH